MSTKPTLEDLKKPFEDNEIGKLPKPTKKQAADALKLSWAEKQCTICGGIHHPRAIHLDYIGHAALTKRMLEVDPLWTWEPLAFVDGLPAFDKTGGLWIKLTILGMTRLGYGNAPPKGEVGNREKEVIGDALRNAGMRFGMGLQLWHKGDLKLTSDESEPEKEPVKEDKKAAKKIKKKIILTPQSNDYIETWKNWIDQEVLAGRVTAAADRILKFKDVESLKIYLKMKLKESKENG